jgi:tetratricopeptide (TPR) repeat protein
MPGRFIADSSFFALALSEIRGFDLGDDAELLSELLARREADANTLEGDDWLLLGVLRHRLAQQDRPGTSDPDAVICFEQAAATVHVASLAHFLRGHTLLRLDRLPDADDAFEQGERVAGDDASCPLAELKHARGCVALAMGDTGRALQLFREGLDIEPASTARWMDIAHLLSELGHDDDASEAIARAVANDPEHVDALYEQSALAAERGDSVTAGEALAQALQLDDQVRTRATTDDRFVSVRDATELAPLLAAPPPPDLRWLDALPSWVAQLRRDEVTESFGISWIDEGESKQIAAAVLDAHERPPRGVMYSDAMLVRARELLRGKRPIAYGPSTKTRERVTQRSLLWLDPEHPNDLWLGLSRSIPPLLWIPVGTSVDGLRASLSEYFPRPQRHRLDMPQVARGFMGYRLRFGIRNPHTGRVEPANARELDRYFMVNPFVEAAFWGSAYDDDPWPDEIPEQPKELLKMSARQRRVAEQAPGQVWSVSRRTRHTRSTLTVELHHRDVFVAEVRYRPADTEAVVQRLNAELGCDYPLDMPVDAIASLMGFQFEQASDLQTRLDSTADPEEIAGLLLVLSGLRHSDLSMTRVYRRYMDHPESVVRTTLCNIFVAHNHESLLEEMSTTEPDDDVRAQIDAVLDEGIGIVQHDPYTDYDEGDIDFGSAGEDEFEVDLDVAEDA